ncbi:guanine nucleotide exchange factor SPIKE 1-like [Carica papaya]|uniref:guanine nucleotide exchange factor SPIKE 1-like n=1 Tax=Carica papaya TaxID=3649 RepID=UPI000B8CECF0|nr:guanine nucleotide exchange factor SPIKE 1-like [Carica papaya]
MQDVTISSEPRGIFYLDAPSASVCLLIQLEKPATEEGGVTASVYSRKEPVHLTEREKQKLQVWSRIMPYRESFAWAIVPLFDNSIGAASGGSASPSSPLAPSMSGSSSHEGVFEPIAKIMLDGKLGYSGGSSVVVEISNLNKVKESYIEESLQYGDIPLQNKFSRYTVFDFLKVHVVMVGYKEDELWAWHVI